MILEFSNLKEEEECCKNDITDSKIRKTKMLDFLKIKKNIMDLIFHNDLYTENKAIVKSNSEPNSKRTKKHLKKMFKKNRNICNNLNIGEEENKINIETKIKLLKIKKKLIERIL